MKKLSFLFGALALAALVSCSSDEVVSQPNGAANLSKQSISFAPLATKTTRSTVYSPTSMFTNFRVIGMWQSAVTNAWIEGKEYVTGTPGDNQTQFTPTPVAGGLYQGFSDVMFSSGTPSVDYKGLEIVSSGTGWDYKDQSKVQYWPYSAQMSGANITGYNCIALKFRAVAPANTSLNLEGGDFTYTTPAVASQVDICYAETNEGKTVTDAPVQMAFHHLFSQVIFKAKKASNYTVDIKSITIGGVGTVATIPFTTIQKTTNVCLSDDNVTITAPTDFPGFTSASYTSIPDQDADASPAQITPAGQELILLPQNITKWDLTASASDSGQGYVAIEYRAKTKDAATWATNTENDGFKTVYFPLNAKWYSGKKYIYTLLFGGVEDPDDPGTNDPENPDPGTEPDDNPGGYDEEGNPEAPTVPITFTASVNDWTEQVVDIDI
mgnify:CR=1 FL=1